jgi:hypothetical protein
MAESPAPGRLPLAVDQYPDRSRKDRSRRPRVALESGDRKSHQQSAINYQPTLASPPRLLPADANARRADAG